MANLLSTIVSGRLAIGSETTTPYLTNALDGIVFGGNEAGYYYRLYTQKENYGGDYTKLNLSWHTGIKIGAWRGYGGIRFYDNSPHVGTEVFSVARGDTHVRVENNLYVGNTIYNNGNAVIHAGNIGSQSVNYATTAGSAPANGGTSTHTYRGIIEDTRAGQRTPNAYDDYRVSWEFTNQMPHDSNWLTVMTMQGWHDGYAAWQIMGTATTTAYESWYLRSGVGTSWNTAKEIIHSGNIASQSVSYADESGYSASAGTTNNIEGLQFRNTGSGGGTNADTIDSNGITYYTSGVSNFSGNATDGALYSQRYSSSWQHQIAGDYRSGQIALRGRNNGTWQDWRIVLDDKNIGSYAVPYGNMTSSTGLNDNKLYLRTNGDNNHYLWNAADDWEELVYYTGTGFRVKGSTGIVAATFTDSGINLPSGSVAQFYTSAGSLRGYIQATDTDDNHFIIATSGGEDIVFKDGGLAGDRNMVIRGNASVEAYGDFRAPIFYDSNDTGYYLDPNSTSYLYHLILSGNSYFRPNTWIQFDGNYGVYWPNHYGLHIYPNNDGSYGSLQVKGIKNSWHGIHFDSGSTLMMNSGETGVHRQGVGWQWRWYNGEMYISAGSTGGGTERTVIHSGNIASQSVNYATSAGDSTNLGGRSSSRYLYYRGISSSGDFQSFQSADTIIRFDQVNDYNGLSNPPGGYNYGGVLSMRGDSFGFQLWGSHTGNFYFKTQWNNDQYSGWREVIHSANIGSYALTSLPSHNHDDRYLPIGGGWYGVNLPGSRWGGYAVNGGEIVFGRDIPNTSQMSILVDGAYLAGENNGFWSLPSNNDWNGRRGMYWDGSNLNFTTNSPTALFNSIRLSTSTNNATLSGNGDWGMRLTTDSGYIQFGPANGSWAHIYSDKNFYMNNHLWVSGGYKVTAWDYNNGGGALYASAFYDANDTTYYLDPNGGAYLRGRVDVVGGHGNSSLRVALRPEENGAGTGVVTLQAWCSEPGNTWDGAGFGYNVDNNSNSSAPSYHFGRPNPAFGQAFMRMFTDGSWRFYNSTSGAAFSHTMTLSADGNVTAEKSLTSPLLNGTTRLYGPEILVNNHSDNTRGYRIHNTSNSSVSAMFVNSSNQLVIAAGAVDQINLNKKVYVNGVALGVNVAPSTTAGRIDASNDIVAYSTSDERFKENITPIPNALEKVKTLTGVEFDWRKETKDYHGYVGHDVGVIAQQVKEVLPEAVRTNANGYLAVRYEKLIGLLIEANKELAARVEELEKKLG